MTVSKPLTSNWPWFMRRAFAEIGKAMRSSQLHPEDLARLPTKLPGMKPDQWLEIRHVTGTELGQRNGRYSITMYGPSEMLRWQFASGELQALAIDEFARTQPISSEKDTE